MKFHKSIKMKLLLAGLLVAAVLFMIFGGFLYYSLLQSYRQDSMRTVIAQQNMAIENIDRIYFQFVRIPHIFSTDDNITRYLLDSQGRPEDKGRNILEAMKDISLLTLSSNTNEYMIKMLISSNRHDRYIATGRVSGHFTDKEVFEKSLQDAEEVNACRIAENPFYYAKHDNERYVILLSEPLYFQGGATQLGNLYLALNMELVRDQFASYLSAGKTPLYIVADSTVYVLTSTEIQEKPGLWKELSQAIQPLDFQNGSAATEPLAAWNGQIMVAGQSQLLGWKYLQPLPVYQPRLPVTPKALVLLFGLAAISAVAVYGLLNHIVAKPAAHISRQLYALTIGDFTARPPLDSRDEFGQISGDISEMAGAIQQLMQTQLLDEKKRNQYAFQMLQSQINPHFLYNTLNSIRWLGEMNGVAGLGEMTTALMRMLRKVTGISTDWCSLRQELEFVKDYEIIQSYRYGNAFHIRYRIEDESCLNARVVKFILQPLVENAIFHGIDPTSKVGIVDICGWRKEGDLVLQVTDNGAGMTKKQLDTLRSQTYGRQNTVKTSSIALGNIHERLVMEYGKGYGLEIRSKLRCYTQVTLRMPLQLEERGRGDV